ncbi:MAG: DUF5683 domain-containing protein [Bacteroidota bacterium]
MKRFFLVFCLFSIGCNIAFCQVPDSINQPQIPAIQQDSLPADTTKLAAEPQIPDSTQTKKPGFFHRLFKQDYPNPNKALYLALAIPGAGQAYNKRWWKMPLVYGAYGGLIYAINYNSGWYRRFRDAYKAEVNGHEHEFSGIGYRADDLKQLRDSFDKNKQLSYIGIVAVHLVMSAEAFVDCHLKTFDVSDDLSLKLKLKPAWERLPSGETWAGVGLSFQFSSKSVLEVRR